MVTHTSKQAEISPKIWSAIKQSEALRHQLVRTDKAMLLGTHSNAAQRKPRAIPTDVHGHRSARGRHVSPNNLLVLALKGFRPQIGAPQLVVYWHMTHWKLRKELFHLSTKSPCTTHKCSLPGISWVPRHRCTGSLQLFLHFAKLCKFPYAF